MNLINRFFREDEGNDAVEYGLILTLVSLLIVAGATGMGTQLRDIFKTACDNLGGAC